MTFRHYERGCRESPAEAHASEGLPGHGRRGTTQPGALADPILNCETDNFGAKAG
jgi:hypothetical protein